MKKINAIIIIALLSLGFLNMKGVFAFPWQDKDKALLKAINGNQLAAFERLLKKGANPNAIFGIKPNEWVMCEANRRGKIAFLKLAVQYGGDINLRLPVPLSDTFYSVYSAPILCSATLHNDKAFDFLLSQSVNLNIRKDEMAVPMPNNELIDLKIRGKTLYGTPLTNAITWNEYHIAYKIMQNKELNWEELWDLKISVEGGGIDPKSEANQWRLKVIDLLRQQGHDIDPERAKKERAKIKAEVLRKKANK